MTFTLTAQEWFDAAWERAQNPVRCEVDGEGCMYSHDGPGGGCFIGVAIPEVHPNMEGVDAAGLVDDGCIAVEDMGENSGRSFLYAIQEVHDGHRSPEWASMLRDIATKYGLTVPGVP